MIDLSRLNRITHRDREIISYSYDKKCRVCDKNFRMNVSVTSELERDDKSLLIFLENSLGSEFCSVECLNMFKKLEGLCD